MQRDPVEHTLMQETLQEKAVVVSTLFEHKHL